MTSGPDDDPRPARAAAALARETGVPEHDVAVVLGSGWGPAAERLGTPVATTTRTALGLPPTGVPGHGDEVLSLRARNGRRVLVITGRVHAYEGRPMADVVAAVRMACAAGCGVVVLTNAAGGISPDLPVGRPVLVSDHLDLTGRSPLVGPRFVDLSDLYDAGLRARARAVRPELREGVYALMPGPQYETPAEIRMLRTLGADVVGMSTVPEAVAARAEGARVLALSLVTNPAAGLGPTLDHADVLAAVAAAGELAADVLVDVVAALPRGPAG